MSQPHSQNPKGKSGESNFMGDVLWLFVLSGTNKALSEGRLVSFLNKFQVGNWFFMGVEGVAGV